MSNTENLKIIWKGNLFNPTGIATANRELVKALTKLGVKVQTSDIWHSSYDFNEGLKDLNTAIDAKDAQTIFADYPQHWRDGYGKVIGFFLHEGTKLHPGWVEVMNTANMMLVPSKATYNLFRSNGVAIPMEVIPYGTNPEIYHPKESKRDENYLFLSINSWTGNIGDRKGTDLLIKAFDEEFKEDEKVRLILKISTFWQQNAPEFFPNSIFKILGHVNKNILINDAYVPESELASYYQQADCFVMPTRGEAFGLTALNAMACGLPIIITKDNNSGHMDFCRGKDSVLWINADKMEQADRRFFAEGNMQPIPELNDLKKQMRYAFEHKQELLDNGLKNSKEILDNWTWEKSATKLIEALK
ncbi:MAG: glycosyltransferase family 4 protein [Chloroflexi bacterium]|nr:glycosyltransferase family 4 protein [Chloroflexota bacterium]